MQNETARDVERDQRVLVIPMTAELDPRVIPMMPEPMHQPIRWTKEPQSRSEWESRGRRPGR